MLQSGDMDLFLLSWCKYILRKKLYFVSVVSLEMKMEKPLDTWVHVQNVKKLIYIIVFKRGW